MVRTYLGVDESVSTFSLVRMVEPFDTDKHGSVPGLPETDDAADVRDVTSGGDKHGTVTDLKHIQTCFTSSLNTAQLNAFIISAEQQLGYLGPNYKNIR